MFTQPLELSLEFFLLLLLGRFQGRFQFLDLLVQISLAFGKFFQAVQNLPLLLLLGSFPGRLFGASGFIAILILFEFQFVELLLECLLLGGLAGLLTAGGLLGLLLLCHLVLAGAQFEQVLVGCLLQAEGFME